MLENGIRSTEYDTVSTVNDVIGNSDGTTGRISLMDLATNLAGTGVNFGINTGRYDLQATDLGVKLAGQATDATANRIALQAAIDDLYAAGGGRIRLGGEGDCIVDLPPQQLDRVILDLGGGILRNTRNAAGYDGFLSTQALQVGKMHPRHMDILPWKELNAVGFGDDAVEPTTSADADGFLAGDMVLVVQAAAGMGAGKVLPEWAQWNRVHSVDGGLVKLVHPMEQAIDAGGGTLGTSAAGAWIANVAYRTRAEKNWQAADLNSWIDGAPWMCDRPQVVNGTLMSQHGGVIQGVGMFEGLWEQLICNPGEAADGRGFGGLFSNAFANSYLRNVLSSAFERAVEIKCLSQNTYIDDCHTYALNHPHGVGEAQVSQISFGEKSRGVLFRGGSINLGKLRDGSADSGLNLINFTPAIDCGLEGVRITSATRWARLVYGQPTSRGCFARGCDFDVEARVCVETEMPDFTFCNNIVRRFTSGTDRYLIRIHGDTKGGRVCDNDFRIEGPIKILAANDDTKIGTEISGNKGISGVDDSSGGSRVILRDNRSAAWDHVGLSGANGTQQNLTVTATANAAIGAPVVIAPGTLQSQDSFKWTMIGSLAGAGEKRMSFRAAVDTNDNALALDAGDDTNIAGTLVFPATCTDFKVTCTVSIFGSTTILTSISGLDLTNNTVLPGGDIGSQTGADFAGHPLRLELSGYKSDGAAIYIVRQITRSAARAGFV